MEPTRDIGFSDFSGRVGKSFAVDAGGHRLALLLESAQVLPGSARPGGAFRLEFLGPVDPILPQATYPLVIDGDRYDIFIVPIGRDQKGTRYDAVFF
jgi:hypothetical protein